MRCSSSSQRPSATLKAIVFVAALVPLARLAAALVFDPDALGANPAEFITRATGDWTLRFLLLTLAVTPLRKLLGWHWLVRLPPHARAVCVLLRRGAPVELRLVRSRVRRSREILKDIVKRPFITVGFTTLVLHAAARDHLDRRDGAASRREALARAASPGLRHRAARGAALLVDGEARPHRAGALRGDPRAPAGVPGRRQGQGRAKGRRAAGARRCRRPGRTADAAPGRVRVVSPRGRAASDAAAARSRASRPANTPRARPRASAGSR